MEPKTISQSMVIWLTGLSGAGKTTLATGLEKRLIESNTPVILLDGDVLREGLNSNLGFSEQDRLENIRRAAEVAKLFANKGFLTICSFITPLEQMRELAKKIIGTDHYLEVFVDCSIETCEKRDVKGLYRKARLNEVKNFTGISAGFEKPLNPALVINSEQQTIDESLDLILNFYLSKITL